VLWQEPVIKSFAGLLHLDPDASVRPHIHLRAVPLTVEQQGWAAAAELAGRRHPWQKRAELPRGLS
jgi:hypothetical protein